MDAFAAFRPHYAELRLRLARSVAAVLLCSVLAYIFKDTLTAWCMQPLRLAFPQMGKLVYTSLPEALISYIKLSLLAGLLFSFPYLLVQVWLFVAPGLEGTEKRALLKVTALATALFAGGAAFGFLVVLPQLLHYLMSYAGPNLTPMLKMGQYLTFIARMTLAFALAFEIPFLMLVAVRACLVGREYFRQRRLYLYLALAVLAFLLAAGDLTATALLCIPLAGLYECGVLACRLFGGKGKTAPGLQG